MKNTPNADLKIFVTCVSETGDTIASAEACSYDRGSFRPNAGVIYMNMKNFKLGQGLSLKEQEM